MQTELHDHESGQEKGRQLGLPLKDFTKEAFEGLRREGDGNEQIPVQNGKELMGCNG